MIFLNNNKWYEENEDLYNVLSDYVYGLRIPVRDTTPIIELRPILEDCWIDELGDLYAPVTYLWSYKGSFVDGDDDEYTPLYSKVPTLTKVEIEQINQDED